MGERVKDVPELLINANEIKEVFVNKNRIYIAVFYVNGIEFGRKKIVINK